MQSLQLPAAAAVVHGAGRCVPVRWWRASAGAMRGDRARRSAISLVCRGALSGDDGRDDGWISKNAGAVRRMPLFLGGSSLVVILLNRTFSGIAAIADASSAQSRADVLALALSATVLLTGLVWRSIESKPTMPVAMDGVECMRLASWLPAEVVQELKWAWEALAEATSTATMVVVYRNNCILQAGLAAESLDQGNGVLVDAISIAQGSLYKNVQDSKKQSYLANLALYPGRFELPFLPSNTQAVILQPLGDEGIIILGGDTLRGFGPKDQGWIVAIGEKLDSTLADLVFPDSGKLKVEGADK